LHNLIVSLAASEGNLAIVKLLLKDDQIKVDVKDRWGNTPHEDAIKSGKINVIQEFETQKKAVEDANNTPHEDAIKSGNIKFTREFERISSNTAK
jgi:ankyrin repeat protein